MCNHLFFRFEDKEATHWITLHYSTAQESEIPNVAMVYKNEQAIEVHIIAESIERFIFSLTHGPNKPTIFLSENENVAERLEVAFDFKFEKLGKKKKMGRHAFWKNSCITFFHWISNNKND